MIDLPRCDQIIQHLRRSILHLIDVDAGVEQETLAADQVFIDERKLAIVASRQRLARVEACPTPRRLEVELRHVRSRACASRRPCRATPRTLWRSCPRARPSRAQTRSGPYRSRCRFAAWPA